MAGLPLSGCGECKWDKPDPPEAPPRLSPVLVLPSSVTPAPLLDPPKREQR